MTLRNLIKTINWHWLGHAVLCALTISLLCSSTDFINTPISSSKDIIIMILHWSTISISLTCLMLILCLLPSYLLIPIYGIIAYMSSALAYFRYTIDFSLNTMLLDIIFQNDITISADLITLPLIIWCLFITSLACFIAWLRTKYTISYRNVSTYIVILIALAGLLFLLNPNGRYARPISERIPFNIYNVTKKYLSERQEVATDRPRTCSYAHSSSNVKTIVVIGEALRPMNMSINGYHRNTTPRLSKRKVISYPNVYSEYVYTNRSVPHMLTRADSITPERAYTERSFIDIFKCANIHTTFIANQDSEKAYVYFMNEADKRVNSNTSKTVYNFEKWLDIDVIPHLKEQLINNDTSQLIVIHTIGSHWWYNSHFTDEYTQYTPIMQSRILSECDSTRIVNSYDNTVLYTDMVLDSIISIIKPYNSVLLYLSDHGEALGEEGKWLHASSSELMHRTASFVWMSDKYIDSYPDKHHSATQNRHKRYSTDYLYHSVIDAADISSDIVDSTLSIFH